MYLEKRMTSLKLSSKHVTAALWIALILLSAYLRFHDLSVRPMHSDEGVNAVFLIRLMDHGEYRYNPRNFHGPSLYYLHLPVAWRAGGTKAMSETVLRSVEALFGTLTVLLFFFSRRRLGNVGALLGAFAFGVSCDVLYFSRYFIHETFFVFATMALYVCAVYWNDTRRPVYAYLGAASASLLFATKETSAIHFLVLIVSVGLAETAHALLSNESVPTALRAFGEGLGRSIRSLRHHRIGVLLTAGVIWLVFFSSFFTHWHGLTDSFRSFLYWTREGIQSGHNKRFLYFFEDFIFRYEMALSVLAFAGLIVALLKNERRGLFLTFWMLGMIGGYSLIPYKTPWLIVNLLLPMALVAGAGFQTVWDDLGAESGPSRLASKGIVATGALVLILIQVPQTVRVVFKEYDNPKHSQVYQHTDRDLLHLVEDIKALAGRSEKGKKVRIGVYAKEYWPLPYYLRMFPNVAYWGTMNDASAVDEPLVLIQPDQKTALEKKRTRPALSRRYTLRPGVPLILYADRSSADRRDAGIRDLPAVLKSRKAGGPLKPGLVKEVYRGMWFQPPPASVKSGVFETDIDWAIDQKRIESPFSIRWTGYLSAPEDGNYRFSLTSDDGSTLLIDGYNVVDNDGTHGPLTKSRTVRLEAGLHVFEIRYFDWVGEAVFRLRWRPPGAGEESAPPRAAFLHAS